MLPRNVVKPTSVPIPQPLLDAVDRRAEQLKITRQRFILRALEQELARSTPCTPGFFEAQSDEELELDLELEDAHSVDDLLAAIQLEDE